MVTNYISDKINILKKEDFLKIFDVFINSEKYFKILFEKIKDYNIELSQEIIHNRIEMYFDDISKDNTTAKETYSKIIEIITNKKYLNNFDYNYLIYLFKKNNFKEGIEKLTLVNKSYKDLLTTYMENKENDKIIDLTIDFFSKDETLYLISLNYFSKIIEQNYLQKFLFKIIETRYSNSNNHYNNLLFAINIVDFISENNNNNISLDIISPFLNFVIEKENNLILEDKKICDDLEKNINDVDKEIFDIENNAMSFNLGKCNECWIDLEMPIVVFYCGHCFHERCFNYYCKNKKDAKCPKCEGLKSSIINDRERNEKLYKKLNNEEVLNKELEQRCNEIEFLKKLYGKGFFDFIDEKDNKKNNNKNKIK